MNLRFQVLIIIENQQDEILKQVQNDGFQYFLDSLISLKKWIAIGYWELLIQKNSI